MNKKFFSIFLIVSTLLSASILSGIVYAYPDTIREKVFTTYLVNPIGTPGTDSYNAYGYSGIHWKTGAVNIIYYIN